MEQMTLMQAMQERHSVRSYLDTRVPEEIREALDSCRDTLVEGQDLHITLVWDDPDGFDSWLAHYGRFRNARNYIVLSAPRGKDLDEAAGYCGEVLVLRAQQLGLRTCWAALTFNRKAVRHVVPDGDALIIVIALGYGADNGTAHRSQPAEKLAALSSDDPAWYVQGVRAALTAPTAINQQKFRITRSGRKVSIRPTGFGPCLRIDQGIVKCHFEIAAGKENFEWA